MIKILLTTHGSLCRGMLETLKIFAAEPGCVQAIPYYIQEEGWDADAEMAKFISGIQDDDTVLVFTDILWGSVNQKMVVELGNRENVHIITGLNLPLVLELISTSEDELTEENIAQKVQDCQQSIVYMKRYEISYADGDE